MAGDLCSVLRRAMFDSSLDARQLVVGLTEGVLMDNVAAGVPQMHQL